MKREIFQELVKIPNLFTLYRFLSVPVLWVLAFTGYPVALGVGYILAGLTDALDGYFARRLDMVTEFGSKFDSLADHLLGPSAIAWVVILEPEVFTENAIPFIIAISTYIIRNIVGWIKFRRLGNLHLYTGKFSGGVLFFFLAHTFLFEGYSSFLFYFLVSIFTLGMLEGLMIFLTQDEVNEHMGSIILVYKRKREAAKQSE